MSVDELAARTGIQAEVEALRRENERLRFERSQDRTLLEAVLRHSPHGILVADATGRIALHNPAAERIWAGSATTRSVSDWSAYRAFHPDGTPYAPEDWPMARCLVENVVIEAQTFDIERFDGTRGRLVGSSAPLLDESGRITGAISVFADVTELAHAEALGRAQEQRFRQLLDSVRDMVFCKDRDLRVVYANRATCEYYGLSEDELRGLTDVPFNERDFTEQYLRDDLRVLQTGETVEVQDEPNLAPSGELHHFHTIKSPIRDGDGTIVELVGVSRDVTERRRAERRFAAHHAVTRLLAEADQLEEVQEALLAAIGVGLDAATALYWYLDDVGKLRCSAAWRAAEPDTAAFEAASRAATFGRHEGLAGQAIAHGRTQWMTDIATNPAFLRREAAAACGLRASLVFPVTVGGDLLGAIEVLSTSSRSPDPALLETVGTIGAQIGLFARRARERSQRQFLAHASEMFVRSLDPLATLAELTRLAVPRLGDWCAVDMVGPDGSLQRLAVHHADPVKVALAIELHERWPPAPDAPTGVPAVIRSGRSEHVPDFPDSVFDDPSLDPEQARAARQLGIRSYVVVPLTSRGRTLGALTLVHSESGRRFSLADLAVAEDLAQRAALSVDNARLFAEADAARRHLSSLFSQTPAPVLVVRGSERRIELANPAWCDLAGRANVVGRPLAEVIPPGWLGLEQGVEDALAAGEARFVSEQRHVVPPGEERWFNFVFQPAEGGSDAPGVIVLAADVTGQVQARHREAEAREAVRRRSEQLALSAAVGVAATEATDVPTLLQRCSEALVNAMGAAFARIWTLDETGEVLELRGSAGLYTHLDGAHARVPIGAFKIGRIAARRAPHLTNDLPNDPHTSDPDWARREGLASFAGYPLVVDGRLLGVLAMFAREPLPDDTLRVLASAADTIALAIQRKRAEILLREETEALDTLHHLGQSLAAELDQDRLVQAITDSATRLAGAEFGAFFYNLEDDEGERYTLYAISGAPREAFSQFPMPRNTAVFAPTFSGEAIVRVDDVTKDPRYGKNAPHHGMPKGHLPVTSYLAVPVVSRSGEVIGGLFFGHSRPGVFTARSERLVVGLAAQAAIAMDNARMFRESRRLIAALERSNAELDQFAYVASHDLKAPLRGIANLSVWLEEDLGDALTGDSKRQLELLRGRVRRMENLIDGILDYSRAGRTRSRVEPIELDVLAREVAELVAARPPARVEVGGGLPTVHGERIPLQQALLNLVANALKHGGPEVTVRIEGVDRGEHVEIRVIDDGTGIAPEFHERIWGIFQTLEARDKVESTGIGLALVRKIVETRGGRAWVESAAGRGSTFAFTWPKTAPGRA